jgi:hypothetical protein
VPNASEEEYEFESSEPVVIIDSKNGSYDANYSDISDNEPQNKVRNADPDVRVVTQRYFICFKKKHSYRGNEINS